MNIFSKSVNSTSKGREKNLKPKIYKKLFSPPYDTLVSKNSYIWQKKIFR